MRLVAKIVAWFLAGLFGLFVVGIGALWYVHRPLHEPSFFVQLTIDLVVKGKPVRIERRVECKTYTVGGSWGRRAVTRYAPTIGALGTRLSDGGAVMMWTPYSCWQEEYSDADGETRLRVRPNAPDYLPFIAWTPDADNPRVLEVYPFASYFERPDARIQVKNIEVAEIPEGPWWRDNALTDLFVTRADPPDEFEWFTHSREGEEIGSGVRGIGVHRGKAVTTLSEAQWRGKSPVLDMELDSYDRPQFISHRMLANGIHANYEAEGIFDEIYWGNWDRLLPHQARSAVKIKYQEGPDRGPLRRDRNGTSDLGPEIFMLTWMGDALILEPTEIWGYLILEVPQKRRRLSIVKSSIIYRDVRFDPDPYHPSRLFYDPDAKVIFSIVSIGLDAKARRGDSIIEWKMSVRKGG